jgi:hypothetical protein
MAVAGTCVFEFLALQGSVVKTRIILPPKTSRPNRKAPGTLPPLLTFEPFRCVH